LYVDTLVQAGVMPDASYIWWAMRPSVSNPTLELRAPDCCSRLDDTVAIAALYRTLVRRVFLNPQLNASLTALSRAIVVENKWRAQRYGVHGTFVTIDGSGAVSCAEFLEQAAPAAEVVIVVMAGIHLNRDALARIAAAFHSHPDAHALYGDLDFLADDGQLWPIAFPAFDYERMLEQGYCAHLFALRRDVASKALQSVPNNLYRLFNTILDHCEPQQRTSLHGLERPDVLLAQPRRASLEASFRRQIEHLTAHHAAQTCRARKSAHQCQTDVHVGVGVGARKNVEGEREQCIAGKYGCRLIECLVRGRTAAPQIIIVHGRQIVMDEGVAVNALHCRARHQ